MDETNTNPKSKADNPQKTPEFPENHLINYVSFFREYVLHFASEAWGHSGSF